MLISSFLYYYAQFNCIRNSMSKTHSVLTPLRIIIVIYALLGQAKRALFGLNTFLLNNKEIPPYIKLSIFNSLVTPILTYGSEVWGYKNCDKIDVFYLGFFF